MPSPHPAHARDPRYNVAMTHHMHRTPEPELMDDQEEARVYAQADFSEVNAKFVRDLLAAVGGGASPLTAMDLGCGPADIPLRLKQQRPDWNVIGLDGAMSMLRLGNDAARSRLAGRSLPLILAAAQQLPVRAASIDLVFSNSLLHHLPEPVPFWKEIGRIAKPGAHVFVRDLMRPASAQDARRIVDVNAGTEPALLQEEFYRSLLAAFTVNEIEQQLQSAGLSRLRVQPVSDRHLDICGRL